MEIGDIPSGSWRGEFVTHASLASNGASAAYGIGTDAQRFRVPQAGIIIGADWEATGASQAATVSTSYRRFTVYNASTDGSGTAVLGSLNLSATLASNATRAFTMQSSTASLTVPAGAIIAVSQTTVGGNDSNGTVVVAGGVHIKFRPI
jgi:gamma-glutamyltranspeptidase